MPDTDSPTVQTPANQEAPNTAHARGYFNQEQINDIALAEAVGAAANANAQPLAVRDIDAAFLNRYADLIAESRSRAAAVAAQADESAEATLESNAAAAALYTALQGIQSAAKQKHRMLAIDGDPSTNFPTDGYLFNVRIRQSRATLLQSAETLIARASADQLPGYKTPESIHTVKTLLDAFRSDHASKQETSRSKELARFGRDELIELLNHHRSAIQHAADAIWPWNTEANRPTRKTFALPLTRPLSL